MSKSKQKIKRCSTCGSFISPKSDVDVCGKHLPATAGLDLGTKSTEDIKKIKENWKPGTLKVRPATKKEVKAIKALKKKLENRKPVIDIDKNKHKDIEDENGGDYEHQRIPDPADMDFIREFVYRGVKPDQLKSILGKIKMDFGGAVEYDVYMRRSGS